MYTLKYQIRNSPKNKRLGNMLDELIDVHNYFLRLQKRYYRRYGKYVSRFRLQPHLTKLLNRTKKHWRWMPRQTVDNVIIRLDNAWQRFFEWCKQGKTGRRVGSPKFKRKGKRMSAKLQTGYLLEKGILQISFNKWCDKRQRFASRDKRRFGFHQHRPLPKEWQYVQITRDNTGEYFLTVVTKECNDDPLTSTGESVGIDFGLKTFLTLSNGDKIESPQFHKQALSELRTLNKSLSRKRDPRHSKGASNNWYRCLRQLARLYKKVSNQRLDWQWKVITDLCRRFDIIVTETLNIDGMKRLWGRKVSDLAFSQFVTLLEYKCRKHSKHYSKVGQWTATTKPCNNCGYINDDLTLKDREWICPSCDIKHDRDINAAKNILRGGLVPLLELV